jgi:LPXTG-motif cell wall-anchored protein
MRNVIARGTRAILTLACLVVAMEGVAAAVRPNPPGAPEISPASLSAGLAILVSGGLILRARRRK